MSLFQRNPNQDLHPLFQLFDDYTTQGTNRGFANSVRAFSPKFDVREQQDTYELQGELPGIEQKDIHIAFADPHTLVVKGRIEREYSSEGSHDPRGRVTGEVTDSSSNSHKATVEDDPSESANGTSKDREVAEAPKQSAQKEKHHKKAPKYWVSERSVGEFHRAFTFPSLVDQNAVKANLKNGILSVVVPKATHHEAKRIMVE